jgi:prevent-host-death family protein
MWIQQVHGNRLKSCPDSNQQVNRTRETHRKGGTGSIIRLVSLTSLTPMRKIQASEAKAHLPQLLDEVERGETLVITRHGRAIARIVPEVDRREEEIDKALANIRELRKRTGKITLDELRSARDEGRKY